LGGSSSDFPKTIFEENPVNDFGIVGDGEETVPELLEIISHFGEYKSLNFVN
jgi:radical SAM superfamily enzyme YgiQ (UPF0313 family)